MKILIIVLLLAIIIALFSGLFFLIKDESQSKRTVNALSWRVGLQVALIVALIVAYFTGALRPHDIYPTRAPAAVDATTVDADGRTINQQQ